MIIVPLPPVEYNRLKFLLRSFSISHKQALKKHLYNIHEIRHFAQ